MQAKNGWIKDEYQVSEYVVEVYICHELCVVNKSSCNKCNEVWIITKLLPTEFHML